MLSDNDVLHHLAANLQRLLVARGWSQSDLARATGEPMMTISRIVRAQNMPGIGAIARIAEAFDVSIDRLTGPPPKESGRTSDFSVKSA